MRARDARLHGRHSHSISLKGTDSQRLPEIPRDSRVIRLLTERKEVPHDSNTTHRLPRRSRVFSNNDVLPATQEAGGTPVSCSHDAEESTEGQTNQPMVPSITCRSPAIGFRLHSPYSTPLQRTDRGTPRRSTTLPHCSSATSSAAPKPPRR